jgi:hypothetical protein
MRVAFLANSFHLKKTKSADFFIELLRNEFGDVTVVPHKEVWAELPGKKWDLLVVWQKSYLPEELEAFGAERVVLVPMYDDTPLTESFWKMYRNFKVFCFSSTLERILTSHGLCAWGVQYFPEPSEHRANFNKDAGLRGFFWQRVQSLDWKLVKGLIGATGIARMNLHVTPELHGDISTLIDDHESLAGRIVTSSWTSDHDTYMDHLSDSNVFFASRAAEGIGMSFLEAMSMGHCVVAPNAPTMNEYLQNGVNGLLYDPDHPAPLDFGKAGELGAAARASVEVGRKKWLDSLPAIRAFLDDKLPAYHHHAHPILSLKGRTVARARRAYRFFKRIAGK